jgi:hypothetical protein
VSSVTVLQHIPFDEQAHAVGHMRAALAEGGLAIVLENVHDQAPHVFSRSIGDWVELFRQKGFQVAAVRRYDYSPALRAVRVAQHLVRGALSGPSRSPSSGDDRGSESAVARASKSAGPSVSKPPGAGSRALRQAQRVALSVDSRLEGLLASRNARLPTLHAGFLFRAV